MGALDAFPPRTGRLRRVKRPDATVLLKWVPSTTADGGDSILALRESAVAGVLTPMVPPLWMYEVGNSRVRRYSGHAAQGLGAPEQRRGIGSTVRFELNDLAFPGISSNFDSTEEKRCRKKFSFS